MRCSLVLAVKSLRWELEQLGGSQNLRSIQMVFTKIGQATQRRWDIILGAVMEQGKWVTVGFLPGDIKVL